MTIPDTIPFSSIVLGERARTQYNDIDLLAESIQQIGLIQPIVLEYKAFCGSGNTEGWLVRAGGRRFTALASLGTTQLFHATSAHPGRPGFLLANDLGDQFTAVMIELAENHDREDIPWQDDLRLTMRAFDIYRQKELTAPNADFSRNGLATIQRQFGAMCKMAAADIKHGLIVHKWLLEDPNLFNDCANIRAAYSKICRKNAEFVAKQAAALSYAKVPLKTNKAAPAVEGPADPITEEKTAAVTIPLSQLIHLTDGITFMKSLPAASVDHIITDPDYAVDVDVLNSNAASAGDGVVQTSIDASLTDLYTFLEQAFRVTRGFVVLFYDLDHHEKLSAHARAVGFRVQRWPLIWIKTDQASNAAPNHNFPKTIEYAMVLRKPSSTLAQVQTACTFSFPSRETTRKFGHPFAKPLELWRWIYSAVAFKGQVVLDPFAGKGSAPCAAIQFGLRPIACEINPAHFGDLTLNLQAYYREAIGTEVAFS